MNRSSVALSLLASIFAASCSASAPSTDAARVAIGVGALELPGVADVEYRVTVTNGATPPAVVWTRDLAASRYGDANGDLAYVGPCDADANDNTVTIEILDLYAGAGLSLPLDPATWHNPGSQSRTVVCLPNADVPVTFDLTVARAATQGFFDVAVSFDDVFCSAKLDCGATTAPADDLLLLHRPDGSRGPTAVLGLACTADPESGATTHLYLDPLRISCGATPNHVVLDPSGLGQLDLGAAPNVVTDGYLFGAAVYRGVEGLANKVYWNVALGLDADHLPAAACTLHARATAAGAALDGQVTPSGTTWPVLAWDIPLTAAGARVCTDAALDTGAGVDTTYTPVGAPHAFTFHTTIAGAPAATRVDVCGDALVTGTETCDDGNTTDDDGCSASCEDDGIPPCGDGVRAPEEACDDGNTVAGDGCSPTCVLEDDPAAFSDLWLWVKADAGVTLTSGAVSTWADQSGNGHDFTQATTSRRPAVLPNAQNGYPAVRLSAAAKQTLNMAATLGSAHTVFVVARMYGASRNRILNAISNNWLLGWWAGYQDMVYHVGWISPTQSFAASTGWLQYTDVNTGSALATYRGGNLMYTAGAVGGPMGLTLSGYAATDGEFSDADVLEVIVYDRALTDLERVSIERYLATRYALDYTFMPPDTLVGVSQWLRADLGVTTVDDAGTARVATWANQAGASPSFTNTDAIATKPVVTANALNGHPAITLTSTQHLGCATLVHSNALTAFIVGRLAGAANHRRVLGGTSSNWLIGWHAGYHKRAYANEWISVPYETATSNWQQYTLLETASNATFLLNGTLLANNVTGTFTGPAGWTLNADFTNQSSDSEVAEIILFSRVLNAWERSEIERYLNARYALY